MKLKIGIGITLFANIFFAISQWIVIAGLNYAGNTDVVGQYAYSLALAGVFLIFGQFGIRPYLLSRTISEQEEPYVIHTRLLTSILALIFLCTYSYFFVDVVYFWLILVLGVAKLVENISDICQGYHQKHFSIVEIAKSRILRALLTPILFFGFYHFSNNIALAGVGVLLSMLTTFYIVDKKVFSAYKIAPMISIELSIIWQIARQSFPMGMASMLVILVTSLPLFILKSLHSDQDIGFYASVFYFVTAGSLILQSAIQVISPILTKSIKSKSFSTLHLLIKRSYLMAAAFGLFGVVMAYAFGEFVLTLFYGNSFSGRGQLLLVASLINFSLAFQAVGGVILTSFGIFKFQMYVMAITLPICFFSSHYLISLYGIEGALYTGGLSALIVAVAFFFKIRKELE
jgi:O-antigen/teichoic acid export membrane protein